MVSTTSKNEFKVVMLALSGLAALRLQGFVFSGGRIDGFDFGPFVRLWGVQQTPGVGFLCRMPGCAFRAEGTQLVALVSIAHGQGFGKLVVGKA